MEKVKSPRIVTEIPGPRTKEFLKELGLPVEYARIYPMPVEAEGIWMKDLDGNIFIDFISGRCVVNVGHRHPKVVQAIKEQADRIIHGTGLLRAKLTKRLAEITPGDFPKNVVFPLSGSGTNDAGIKLARFSSRRPYIIAFTGAYHGVTYGALSVSSYLPRMVKGYGPNLPGIYHMPYPYCYRCPFRLEHPDCGLQCLTYIEDYAFKSYLPPEEVAAVLFEPIEGDAGWIVPPDDWLPTLKRICDDQGILLIAEEVQTGFGRTGKWFAVEHWDTVPDIILLGKAIASGVPLAACVGRADLFEREGERFGYGHTFSSSPLSCAAALATIDVIEGEKLVENSAKVGGYLKKRLEEMKEEHRVIGDVRGKGLLLGAEIVKDKESKKPGREEAREICQRAVQKGLYIIHMGAYGTATLRIAPPLIITQEQVDIALNILEEAISETER